MAKAQAQEPSMEEILASIRRIIADEEKPAPKAAAPEPEPEPEAEERISEEDLDKLFAAASDDDDVALADPEPDPEEDVLDLTEDSVAGTLDLVDGLAPEEEDLQFSDPDPEPEPEPVFVAPPPPPPPPPKPAFRAPSPPTPRAAPVGIDEDRLLSEATDHAVASAFDDLALTILNKNARTLEDLVQDMLRPMLKTWLDRNLPGMVERMVRAEIERVARGR